MNFLLTVLIGIGVLVIDVLPMIKMNSDNLQVVYRRYKNV